MSAFDPRPDDDPALYIGYLPVAPPAIARLVRRVLWGTLTATATAAVTLAALQSPFGDGWFGFGERHSFRGRLVTDPYPLLVDDGGAATLLVGPGKRGARDLVDSRVGLEVTLEGSPIRHREIQMAALDAATPIEPVTGDARGEVPPAELLGILTLQGEIVDSKCYLGVMKPGRGKPHQSCAARCIAGGIPPMLRVATVDGEERLLLLVGEHDEPLGRSLLAWVGRPVEITGRVERRAGLFYLVAATSSYRAPVGPAQQ